MIYYRCYGYFNTHLPFYHTPARHYQIIPQDLPGAVSPPAMMDKFGLNSAGSHPLKNRNWYMQVRRCVYDLTGVGRGGGTSNWHRAMSKRKAPHTPRRVLVQLLLQQAVL